MTKRIVVAYGGSLEGAAALALLARRLDADLATLETTHRATPAGLAAAAKITARYG
jgi:hypothetical protein